MKTDPKTLSRIRRLELLYKKFEENGMLPVISSTAPEFPCQYSIWIDSDDDTISYQYKIGNDSAWIVAYTSDSIVDLNDVDDTNIGIGKILKVGADGVTHEYVNESGGITDAPSDGTPYARKDAGWVGVSGGLDKTFQTLTDATTIAFDMATSVNGAVTITTDRIAGNFTNPILGEVACWAITQGGTGGNIIDWDTYYEFSGGIEPVLSGSVGSTDYIYFLIVSATKFVFQNINQDS